MIDPRVDALAVNQLALSRLKPLSENERETVAKLAMPALFAAWEASTGENGGRSRSIGSLGDRWLYRLARKAVPEKAEPPAITFRMRTLQQQSGTTRVLKLFAFDICRATRQTDPLAT